MRTNQIIKKLEEKEVIFENENMEYGIDDDIVADDGKRWKWKSDISMELPIATWCEQFDDVGDSAWIAVFGLGEIGYLLELTKRHEKNIILVYEPDEKNIVKQLQNTDMTELLSKENIIWVAGKEREKKLCKIIDENIDYRNGMRIEEGKIPNYSKAYPKEYAFFKEQIRLARVYMSVSRNTRIGMEEVRGKSFLYNINDLPEQSSVNKLIKAFKNVDVTEYPAVIIAAGPSLDHNIMDLVPYQDKVFIVCLDTAIKTAFKWGINPDLMVCVDPVKQQKLFENKIGQNTPLVTSLYGNYKVNQIHNARRFYCSDNEPFEKELYNRFNCNIGVLASGGSVANTAFSLLIELGFKKIILIGQDLAYPNKRLHTEEAHMEMEMEIDVSDNNYFYVEGVDGKPVLTEYNMFLYNKWFEEQAHKYLDVEIIDATEGGALIKGTKIQKLKEALENNCNKKKDFRNIINNAEELLDSINKKIEMKDLILETINNIPEVINELKNITKTYDKLDKLNRAGKQNTNAFKKCLTEITVFNNKMDNSLEIMLMQLFANKGDYQVTDSLQKKTTSQYEEIKLMKVGRELVETYINAGNKLIKSWNEVKFV